MSGSAGKRSEIFPAIFRNFRKNGFAQVTLVTGTPSTGKTRALLELIAGELERTQREPQLTVAQIMALMTAGEYPDFYFFPEGPVRIGEGKKEERGTVRHMLRHFLPYAPRNGGIRFVFFAEAGAIRNEAESALLKTLEEPPDSTKFILSAASEYDIRDTILSRCLPIPYVPEKQAFPDGNWAKFLHCSGTDPEKWGKLKEAGKANLERGWEELTFRADDYPFFDSLSPVALKEKLGKSEMELSEAARLAWLPLYYSLRDHLLGAGVPGEGPLRLPFENTPAVITMVMEMEHYFSDLEKRIFGSRSLHLGGAFHRFMASFFPLWIRAGEKN